MSVADSRPVAIDLFSGAGGLTLGLKRAGFRVVAAVELCEEVAKTYRANHPEVALIEQDVRTVTGREVLDAAGVESVDLVAGCPPCQGFSKLTDKYEGDDPRNDLVLEMARLVVELKPRTVMMENVPGLAGRGRALLDEFLRRLRSAGYLMNHQVLQLANYGVPQSRRRLVALGGLGVSIPMPAPTHSRKGDPKAKLAPWLTLRDAITGMPRPVTLQRAFRDGGPQARGWHVVSGLSPLSKARLRAIKPGVSREMLPKRLRPKCHRTDGAGFQNVYGRMSWNRIPPTMTGGCTTPCKGRFGHPSRLGTISVREAALIQTFPPDYVFATDYMRYACEMVGNALPPKFAEIAAGQCLLAVAGVTIN